MTIAPRSTLGLPGADLSHCLAWDGLEVPRAQVTQNPCGALLAAPPFASLVRGTGPTPRSTIGRFGRDLPEEFDQCDVPLQCAHGGEDFQNEGARHELEIIVERFGFFYRSYYGKKRVKCHPKEESGL